MHRAPHPPPAQQPPRQRRASSPASQPTVMIRPVAARPIAPRQRPMPNARRAAPTRNTAHKPAPHKSGTRANNGASWRVAAITGVIVFGIISVLLIALAGMFVFAGNRVLPGVHVAGVALGGMTRDEAAAAIGTSPSLYLRDETRIFPVSASDLGIEWDAEATAERAVAAGRATLNNLLPSLFGRVNVAPAIRLDAATTAQALSTVAPEIEIMPANAGVQWVDGRIEGRAAVIGRAIDIEETLYQLETNTETMLADGMIELSMRAVEPEIIDPAPIVAAAETLLASPLSVQIFDPIRNEALSWSIAPSDWGNWVTASSFSTPDGIALTLEDAPLRAYLAGREAELGGDRRLDMDAGVRGLQQAVETRALATTIRAFHRDTQYTVQPGDTLMTIAYDYGMPYLYIERANPGIGALSVGQTITLPSRDMMLPLMPIASKRIVVNMNEQRVRVYENGALRWDWAGSTGIADSPTWPGVYQIISHEPNAYAGNWNLWMPNFMGVYRPIPDADFTNGFHGFPSRGGAQLLWTNNLGTRVTYGCILLSTENIQLLYDWAEEGVVVEIQG